MNKVVQSLTTGIGDEPVVLRESLVRFDLDLLPSVNFIKSSISIEKKQL